MTARLAYNLQRTTAPTEEPVDLCAVKRQCTIEELETYFDDWFAGNPAYTGGAIAAARAMVEHDAQVALMPQTWTLRLDDWPLDDWVDLRIHPVQSLTISYEDEDDATQTWAASNYELQRSEYRSIVMKTDKDVDFPDLSTSDPRPVTLTLTCGYSNTTDQTTTVARRALVPHQAKHAILMLVEHWFRNRGSVIVGVASKEIELGYKSLIESIRPSRYV